MLHSLGAIRLEDMLSDAFVNLEPILRLASLPVLVLKVFVCHHYTFIYSVIFYEVKRM